jgi:hypothetical protein
MQMINDKKASLPFSGIVQLFIFCALLLLSLSPIAPEGRTVESLPVPEGFMRIRYPEGSFSRFLQRLPLKSGSSIYRFDGRVVNSGYDVMAVVALPLLFQEDLEQCADYAMRFWAEYHKASNILNQLYLFDYSGNKIFFRKQNKSFSEFLRLSMAYSNSYSIKAGANAALEADLRPGDMFVQNETGSIGHVSMIVDACGNTQGENLFLIGFSFMPAQEFHIEKAPPGFGTGEWFTYQGYCRFLETRYPYGVPRLRRF